jgi:hypothetical protein
VYGFGLGLPQPLSLEDQPLLLLLAAGNLHNSCTSQPIAYLEHEVVLDILVESRRLVVLECL